MKSYLFSVDVESDGPCPGLYSMVNFGACVVTDNPQNYTFYGETAPISNSFLPEALNVSGKTREQHLNFQSPEKTMREFADWINKICDIGRARATLISDNPAFDWQFINYYFHKFLGDNPFGFSARRIGDIYSGLGQNFYIANKWKSLRKTTHDHNPVNDAIGNAEALLYFRDRLGLKL